MPASIVNVAEAKAHLRIDYADDDEQLEAWIQAATEFINNETGIDWANRTDNNGDPLPVPHLIRAAVLMLVGHFYGNREATSPLTLHEVPLGVQRIIEQHRIVELL